MNIGQLYKERKQLNKQLGEIQHSIYEANKKVLEQLKWMDKSDRIRLTFTYPELSIGCMDLLTDESFAFKTGSTVFSPRPENANDIDYVVLIHPRAFTGYAVGAEEADYWEEDNMSVLYAHRDGKLYNIICIGDLELFNAWRRATEIMQSLMANCSGLKLERKWARVRIFRALKDVLFPVRPKRTAVAYDIAIKHNMCVSCGREAINFIDKAHRESWQKDGICDRCREEFHV